MPLLSRRLTGERRSQRISRTRREGLLELLTHQMAATNGLPCSCRICQIIGEVGIKDTFNEFRKKHFICLKGGLEMDEIHRGPMVTDSILH